MATQAEIEAALATVREAQIVSEGAISTKLLEVVALIDANQNLYQGGLSKTLADLRNIAALTGQHLAPPAA